MMNNIRNWNLIWNFGFKDKKKKILIEKEIYSIHTKKEE